VKMMQEVGSVERRRRPALANGLLVLAGCSGLAMIYSRPSPSALLAYGMPSPPPSAPPPAMPKTSVGGNPLVLCPPWAPMLGTMGAAAALVFSNVGAAYGTAKAAQGISTIGRTNPELVFKNIVPIVMAGVLSIYGMIIGVIIANGVNAKSEGILYSDYSLYTGFSHLGAGLTCGLTAMSCGIALGIAGDAGVRAVAAAKKGKASDSVYIGMVLIQGTGSALGMYGLIVALIMTINTSRDCGVGSLLD